MNNPTDDSTDSIIVDIVEVISQKSGRGVFELPPLYEAIDPDVLNTIISGDRESTTQFEYVGYAVCVSSALLNRCKAVDFTV